MDEPLIPTSPATPPRAGVVRPVPRPRPGWVFAGTPREDGDVPVLPSSSLEPSAATGPDVYRPSAPRPVPSQPMGPVHPAPDAEVVRARSGRGTLARVGAGSLALVVVLALVLAGLQGIPGGREAGPEVLASTSATPSPTANHATSRSRTPGEREPGSVASEVTAEQTQNEPGGRGWTLPERDWEPLPGLDPPDEYWTYLQGADLYGQNPVTLAGCPEPTTAASETHYRELVRAQWECVHVAWVPVFEAMGWSTVEPAVEFYPGKGSKSECGYLEAPAFYCSAGDGTAFFGGDHFEMARKWDLSVNEMVNHEYGHHLQSLAGVTSAKQQVVATDDVERRSELQATCWSAMMTYHNGAFEFGQENYDGWQNRLETMLVDGVHGSRESLLYWGTRGLYAETLDDCNTWVVDSAHVS